MGHSQYREAVQSVGSKFQVEDGVAKIVVQQGPDGSVVRKHDDARMVVAQTQLDGGTDHTLGLNAPDLSCLQGFMPLAVGVVDIGADFSEADLLAGGHVGRAADHFQFLGAGGHHAKAQTVGVGMGADVGHMADENLVPASDDLNLTNLDAGHGQPMGQLLGRQVNVHVLSEPA